MKVILESNGWKADARINIIGGNRPSIIGRDLMTQLGLQLIQHLQGAPVMSINNESQGESGQGAALDSWQENFGKLQIYFLG